MTYEDCLKFLYEQIASFQLQGASAFNKNLDKTIALCEAVGDPQNQLKFIHVAGTNGKGSVCHGLASIFSEAGYKTGLFTSPHLFDFRERIQVNGSYIEREFVTNFVNTNRSLIDDLKPSFFELTFAMAVAYFNEQGCDMVILETGMGGRLDSTNIVSPLLCIITTIGMDHQQYLGDTIEKITAEKAGIIKPGIPVVVGNVGAQPLTVIENKASEMNAPLIQSQSILNGLNSNRSAVGINVEFALKGDYQQDNLATILTVVQQIPETWSIKPAHIEAGLKNVPANFPLFGRWQILSQKPRIICDVGHNEEGIKAIFSQLKGETYKELHIVFGMANDKDTNILQLLPKNSQYHLCQASTLRAMNINELEHHFRTSGFEKVSTHSKPASALNHAISIARENDLVLIIGSIFVVGEVLENIEKGAITFAQ